MSAERWTALGVALLLLVFGAWALDDYNVTWDEALGDFFFGDRYLRFYRTLDPEALDFMADLPEAEGAAALERSPFRGRPWEYPPVAATAGAATSEILSGRLGLVDPFDGFHAVNVVLAVALAPLWLLFLSRRIGLVAATTAVGLLVASPRLIVHWMANIKDFPSMALFTATVAAGFAAVESGRVRWLLATGALWGLALGTKFNALFLPAIPLLGILASGVPAAWNGRRFRLVQGLVGASAIGLLTLIASWPWLWADPVGRLGRHVAYLAGRRAYTAEHSLAPVLETILLTTPPVFLLLAAIGLVPLLDRLRRRDALGWWVFAWIAVVLGRYLPPQAVNFDGVRHFLELFPALGVLGGLGLSFVLDRLGSRLPLRRRVLAPLAIALALLPGASRVLATHPFQIAYWNLGTGGPGGAWEAARPQSGDYWGTSYRQGLEWISRNASPGAYLVVPVIEHAVRLVAPERLRPDVTLLPVVTPFSPRIAPERLAATRRLAAEEEVWVMFVVRRDWMNELMADCWTRLAPAAAWDLDGAPILRIYRYVPPPGVPTEPQP